MARRPIRHCFPRPGTACGERKPDRAGVLLPLVTALLLGAGPARAIGPLEIPETWGGDLLARQRLTGNWGGPRDQLGQKGIVLDFDLVLTPQFVMSGGRDTGAVAWGNAIYTLNVDTGKAGWWPGGFFSVKGDSGVGNAGYGEVGALAAANVSSLVPAAFEDGTGLENATFTQFLSPRFGLMMGKFYTLALLHGEFQGNMHTQFMNTGLTLSAVSALVPISAFGGGAVFLPAEDVTILALALDSSGEVMENDIEDAFDDGVTLLGGVTIKIAPFGLVGHQKLEGMWSDKTRLSLEQDPENLTRLLLGERFPRLGDPGPVLERILSRRFPNLLAPAQGANQEDDTWYVTYGFDQYLWQPAGDATRGLGFFFNVGASDGNPNPIEYSYMLGVGGKGIVPGRPRDTFGVGWTRLEFSDDFVPFLRQRLPLGVEDESTVEMYYNASLTPWLNVSPSLQITDPGLDNALNERGQLEELDTALVFFLRTFIRF